jgi:hypothetical protein
MSAAPAPARKRWSGLCRNCEREAELETRYDIGARALCDPCAARLHTAQVVDLENVRASRASTSSVGGSSTDPSSLVVDVEVVVEVGSKPGQSAYFTAFERDAPRFGAKPLGLELPNDLSPAQRLVAEDVAYVLGVYEVHDGPGVPQPYSQRFGAERMGLHYRAVGRALRVLFDCGVLVEHGETAPHRGYPRGTRLVAAPQQEVRQT